METELFFDAKKDRLYILLNPFEGMMKKDEKDVFLYEDGEWKEIREDIVETLYSMFGYPFSIESEVSNLDRKEHIKQFHEKLYKIDFERDFERHFIKKEEEEKKVLTNCEVGKNNVF